MRKPFSHLSLQVFFPRSFDIANIILFPVRELWILVTLNPDKEDREGAILLPTLSCHVIKIGLSPPIIKITCDRDRLKSSYYKCSAAVSLFSWFSLSRIIIIFFLLMKKTMHIFLIGNVLSFKHFFLYNISFHSCFLWGEFIFLKKNCLQ